MSSGMTHWNTQIVGTIGTVRTGLLGGGPHLVQLVATCLRVYVIALQVT